jgi:hypothetical protein
MADLTGKGFGVGIEDTILQSLVIDSTAFFDPLHQTLLVDVFGRPCAVTHCQERVHIINGLAIAEAAGWIAFQHGGLCLLGVEGASEDALSL